MENPRIGEMKTLEIKRKEKNVKGKRERDLEVIVNPKIYESER